MDEILEEIQNDLREEKLKALWNRYKRLLFWSLGGGLVLLGAGISFSHWKEAKKNEVAHTFLGAEEKIHKGDLAGGIEDLKNLIQTTSHETYKTLARLRWSALPSVSDEERLKIYEDILQDKATPSRIHDHVLLMKTLHLVDRVEAQEIPDLIQKLDGFKKPDHPLAPLAHELIALLYYRLNRYPEAAQSASQVIAHPEASEALRLQATALLHQSDLKLAKEKGPSSLSASQPVESSSKS